MVSRAMGGLHFNIDSARKTAFRITALVNARAFRRDFRAELDRVQQQPRARSYAETALTLGVLLALALVAASFGWIGMCLYFLGILILF